MRSIRSFARSRLGLILVLLAGLAQQAGLIAHGAMLARAGSAGNALHEICTSAGLVRLPGAPSPAQPPAGLGAQCDHCIAATTALLPGPLAPGFAVAPAPRGEPAPVTVLPVRSTPQRAYRSRAPPVPLSV